MRSRFFCVAAGALLALPAAPLPAQPPASPVGVDEVRFEIVDQTVDVLGRLVSTRSGVTAARVGGPVVQLRVDVGDRVDAGDVLAEIDQARLETKLKMQQAELATLRAARATAAARAAYAEEELARVSKLKKGAALSRYDLDTRRHELTLARAGLAEADARLEQSEQNTRLAEIELRDGTVVAPFAGVVSRRHTSTGAWLRPGDPVVTLIDDISLEIEADVPADRIDALRRAPTLRARVDAGYEFDVRVRAVVPDENPSSRTRPVRFIPQLDEVFADAAARDVLAVNQPVTLRLPAVDAGELLSVAKDAVLRQGDQAIVFVVADGVAQPRPVELGQAFGGRFQVLSGLDAGEQVVVRGNERLRPGQAVRYPGQPPVGAGAGNGPGSSG